MQLGAVLSAFELLKTVNMMEDAIECLLVADRPQEALKLA
jgi:hypothetical protein